MWWGWSYLLTAGGVFGLWLAGRKNWWGWVVGLAMQLVWLSYAVITAQWGFIVSALAYGAVYAANLRRWIRPDKPSSGRTSSSPL
jgi:hypothetical protein